MHCLISEFEVLGIKGSFLHSELISNLSRALCKKARCLHQPQAAHLLLFEKETASHNSGSEWDALSLTSLSRKLHPTLSAHSGTQLPNGPRFGNHIPFRVFKAGRGFPEKVSTTYRRRLRLLRAHRAPACGGGIRAQRAWRALGGDAHAG